MDKRSLIIFAAVMTLLLSAGSGYAQMDRAGKTVTLAVAENSAIKTAAPMVQTTCPVMAGEAIKKKFFVDHKGHRIYLCCKPCVRAFKRDPEKYMKKLRGE